MRAIPRLQRHSVLKPDRRKKWLVPARKHSFRTRARGPEVHKIARRKSVFSCCLIRQPSLAFSMACACHSIARDHGLMLPAPRKSARTLPWGGSVSLLGRDTFHGVRPPAVKQMDLCILCLRRVVKPSSTPKLCRAATAWTASLRSDGVRGMLGVE